LLINAGASDGLVREIDALRGFRGDKDVFQYLQQQTWTPYYELPLGDRFCVAESIDHERLNEAELTRIALVPEQFDQEMAVYADEYGMTLLHIVTRDFAYDFCRFRAGEDFCDYNNTPACDDIYEPNNPWRVLIRDVVTAGASLHAINSRKRSILGYIISTIYNSHYIHGANECFVAIPQLLEIWLSDLREVGVDLVRYGADEKALYLTGAVDNTFECWRWFDENEGQTSISFSYGPRPQDWHIWLSEPTDVFAGEFWEMIENPAYTCTDDLELPIPGSWSD
jgi:hypothetical protein